MLQLPPSVHRNPGKGTLEGPESMADLLRRVAENRDNEAFRRLFLVYAPRLKSYLMRQGADAQTAEELGQETLLTVWRKAALYSDEKGSATSWIFAIARNLRIDRLRREVPWQELPKEREEEASSDQPADQIVWVRERQQRVRAVISRLPGNQHDVLSLSYIEGLSHSEIAEHLNVPLGTVKSRMRLAYQRIREVVGDLK
jgi:RNA polymerase sigma-70 factor (ECF subfamily)